MVLYFRKPNYLTSYNQRCYALTTKEVLHAKRLKRLLSNGAMLLKAAIDAGEDEEIDRIRMINMHLLLRYRNIFIIDIPRIIRV